MTRPLFCLTFILSAYPAGYVSPVADRLTCAISMALQPVASLLKSVPAASLTLLFFGCSMDTGCYGSVTMSQVQEVPGTVGKVGNREEATFPEKRVTLWRNRDY